MGSRESACPPGCTGPSSGGSSGNTVWTSRSAWAMSTTSPPSRSSSSGRSRKAPVRSTPIPASSARSMPEHIGRIETACSCRPKDAPHGSLAPRRGRSPPPGPGPGHRRSIRGRAVRRPVPVPKGLPPRAHPAGRCRGAVAVPAWTVVAGLSRRHPQGRRTVRAQRAPAVRTRHLLRPCRRGDGRRIRCRAHVDDGHRPGDEHRRPQRRRPA